MEEKNRNLSQKVIDLKEDIDESELQRINEKKSKTQIKEKLNEQKALVRQLEGEIIELEMKLDELRSHDQIVLKERDQYSDSKFHLEGKLKQMEVTISQHKKEYLEMLQIREEMETEISELKRELLILKEKGNEGKMDWIFVKKLLHLAGNSLFNLLNLQEESESVLITQMQLRTPNSIMTQMNMVI